MENVSWNDAQEYVKRLTIKTGKSYLLPSEAQWEYAARAGTTTAFHTGERITTDQANYVYGDFPNISFPKVNPSGGPTKVASFAANAFGLSDMHGNVWEWVQDCYAAAAYQGKAPIDGEPHEKANCPSRVSRGGSYLNAVNHLRSSARNHLPPAFRDGLTGFRVCRVSP